jgi:hypothetical protein
MTDVHDKLFELMVQLVLDGWEPISSGDGQYLYWKKGDSYDHPGPRAGMGKEAVDICSSKFFRDEIEQRRTVGEGKT